jgi:hypothetical protein
VFDGEERGRGVVTKPEGFMPALFGGDKVFGVWRDKSNAEYVVRPRIVGDLGLGAT